jgi:hypothetical protein
MNCWERVKAICFRSLTIAWAYVLGLFGMAMGVIEQVAIVLQDPTIVQKVTEMLGGTSPRVLAAFSLVVSMVTLVTRARGLLAGKGGS